MAQFIRNSDAKRQRDEMTRSVYIYLEERPEAGPGSDGWTLSGEAGPGSDGWTLSGDTVEHVTGERCSQHGGNVSVQYTRSRI